MIEVTEIAKGKVETLMPYQEDQKMGVRKSVGKPERLLSPLQRAFELKKMCEAIRGERINQDDENVRRVVRSA